MRIRPLGAIFFLIVALNGCNKDPLDVDVSNLEPQLTFKRLDQDLFNLNPAAGETDTEGLYAKYGEFLIDYTEGVLRIGNPESEAFPYAVAQFITVENMLTLYNDVQTEYENIEPIESAFTDAFAHYKYHFPDSTVPEIVFNISALNYAIVATPSTLGIGLDMFLGADYPIYPMVGLPQYMYKNMKPEQVLPQAIKGWLQSMYETEAERDNLLEYMVFEGKLLYCTDALLRNTPDSIKIGFSPDAMDWCTAYEARVWAHLVDEELLYSTEYMNINKWINQAPFVAGIPKDSPGRLGQWVGWQIVRNYMKNNPEATILQLMENQNAHDILTRSKYKPKL
jgi:hypothetical protein